MVPRFEVTIEQVETYKVTCEADSPEQAEELALNEMMTQDTCKLPDHIDYTDTQLNGAGVYRLED